MNLASLCEIINDLQIDDPNLINRLNRIWEALPRHLKTMDISTTTLSCLIDDMMDLAKLNHGKFSIHPEVFEISQLIEEIKFIFEFQCQQKGINFEIL